jgi:ferredoxin
LRTSCHVVAANLHALVAGGATRPANSHSGLSLTSAEMRSFRLAVYDVNVHPPPTRSYIGMKVWIDQDLCTGDGLCEEIAPDVFTLLDDGLAYVKEGDKVFATAKGNPQGADGMAEIPDGQLDGVIESAEECPGECIFIEP